MKIACPNCATTYEVAPAAIGAEGRSVRCVRCRSVWFVSAGQAEPEPAPVAAAAEAVPAAPAEPTPAPSPASTPASNSAPAAAVPDGPADLDDLAAWGLDGSADEPANEPAGDPADFSMDAMLEDMQAAAPLTDGPPLVPVDDWQGLEADLSTPPMADDAGPGRPRHDAVRHKRSLRPPSMPTVIVVLAAVLAGILGWRADVVRVMPQTASLFAALGLPVNLRGLAFQDVKTTKEVQDGIPVLVVEGRIVNISKLMLEVPRIRFAMRNAAGNEVYNWTTLPTQPVLAPRAEEPFRTRLASPPAEGRDITVRFFNRRDVVGGLR